MTTILNGVLGGVIVGLLATVATRLVGDGLSLGPGTRAVSDSDRFVESPWLLGVLLVGYGSSLGAALVALELFVLGLLGVPPTLAEALGVALGWSALVFGAVFLLWRFGSGATLTRSRRGRLLVYHLVYGVGLGVWIRLTWIT